MDCWQRERELTVLLVQDASHLDHLDLKAHLWGVGTLARLSPPPAGNLLTTLSRRARLARALKASLQRSAHLSMESSGEEASKVQITGSQDVSHAGRSARRLVASPSALIPLLSLSAARKSGFRVRFGPKEYVPLGKSVRSHVLPHRRSLFAYR